MSEVKFIDIEQNSDEWFALRAGRITSSALDCIMAHYGKDFGEPAKKYAINLAAERLSGKPSPSTFKNAHMERGHKEEPEAREAYDRETWNEVKNGGFYCNDTQGVSLDGNVGDAGAIEIKCQIPSAHFECVKKQSYKSTYKWQCVNNMRLPGKEWIDFVSYCPIFPKGKEIYIYRMFAKDFQQEIDMIESRIEEFEVLIEQAKCDILESQYRIGF